MNQSSSFEQILLNIKLLFFLKVTFKCFEPFKQYTHVYIFNFYLIICLVGYILVVSTRRNDFKKENGSHILSEMKAAQ